MTDEEAVHAAVSLLKEVKDEDAIVQAVAEAFAMVRQLLQRIPSGSSGFVKT